MSSASSLSHNEDENEHAITLTEVYDEESPSPQSAPTPAASPGTPRRDRDHADIYTDTDTAIQLNDNNDVPPVSPVPSRSGFRSSQTPYDTLASSGKMMLSSTMVDLDDTIDGLTIPTRPDLDKAGISQELVLDEQDRSKEDAEYYFDDATIATKSTFHRQGPTPIDMTDFLRRQQLEQLAHDPSYYHTTSNNNNNNNMPQPQQSHNHTSLPNHDHQKTPIVHASRPTNPQALTASGTKGTSTSASPENNQQPQQRRKGYKWWAVVVLLFLAVGIIIGLLVALVFTKESADPNPGSDGASTVEPTVLPLPSFQVQLLTTVNPAELEGSGLLQTITADHLATTMRPGILLFDTIDLDMLIVEEGNHHNARQLVDEKNNNNHKVTVYPLVTARFEGTLHLQSTATVPPLPSRIQQLIQLAFSGTKLDQYRQTVTDLGLETFAISVSNAASSSSGTAGTIVFGCSPISALLPGCNDDDANNDNNNSNNDSNPPTLLPTHNPTALGYTKHPIVTTAPPSLQPSPIPTKAPTDIPTTRPTPKPTSKPTNDPTDRPTVSPTVTPPYSWTAIDDGTIPAEQVSWTTVGAGMAGSQLDERQGNPISLSSNGKRMAVGGRLHDSGGTQSLVNNGIVRVFEEVNGNWNSLGQSILGTNSDDEMGWAVAMSGSGSRVAVGATGYQSDTGLVQVYELVANGWVKVGDDIVGDDELDSFGSWISMSEDGNEVAIGASQRGGTTERGYVRVFRLINNSWQGRGTIIRGEANGDRSGQSLALTRDGTVLAIGGLENDDAGVNSGHVRVFGFQNGWSAMGPDLNGEATGDRFGRSVALSDDGGTVAVGGNRNNANGADSGHVQVFQYNSNVNTWQQMGDDIDGKAASDEFGWRVELSSDGKTLAVGAWGGDFIGNGIKGEDAGYVSIFRFIGSSWVQLGENIFGLSAGDEAGRDISISADGSRIAVGAPRALSSRGNIRIFDIDTNGS